MTFELIPVDSVTVEGKVDVPKIVFFFLSIQLIHRDLLR